MKNPLYIALAALAIMVWGGVLIWQLRDAAYDQGVADERAANAGDVLRAAEDTAQRLERIGNEVERLSDDGVMRMLYGFGIVRPDADR